MIIVVYETLGGFRAVAWTDVIQGSVLLVGFMILVWMVLSQFGGLEAATLKLMEVSPEKVAVPDANRSREWFSYVVLVGLGGALYPQSVQRIYAAKSAKVLRKSLMVMAFLPLTTTLIAVGYGVYSILASPGAPSDAGHGDRVAQRRVDVDHGSVRVTRLREGAHRAQSEQFADGVQPDAEAAPHGDRDGAARGSHRP